MGAEGEVANAEYAVFLRGISNVPMQPFRDTLEGLGLSRVRSYGGTGNLVFDAPGLESASALEDRIAAAFGVDAFVRTRAEVGRIVARDPFAGVPGAAVFIARREMDAAETDRLMAPGFAGEPPVVDGATVYFVHPLRRPERTSVVDLERVLGVRGTMRASAVVGKVLRLM